MKNIFFSKSFIPRRNFDYKLSHFPFKIFFYNFFFRKVFKIILNVFIKIKKNNFISRRLGHYFYYCQKIKLVGKCNLSNEKLYNVKIGDNLRNIILCNTSKKILINLNRVNNSKLFFGISILENQKFVNNKVFKYDLRCKVLLKNEKSEKVIILQLPIKNKKHGLYRNIYGNKFFDFHVDLKEFYDQDLKIEISFIFNKNTFLALEEGDLEKYQQDINTIAVSSPFLNKDNVSKKVFLLSIESMTNFLKLEKTLGLQFELPFLKDLISKYNYSNNVSTAADWTMPNLYSLHSGLTPFQHGVCDPRAPIYKENTSDEIFMLAQYFKKNNFYNTAFVSGSRFEIFKNWTKGYDNIYKSSNAFDENAPNFDNLKKFTSELKDKDLFIYMHYDILHSPFLHLNNRNMPLYQNAETISSAIKNRNFYPIYKQQLEKFDKELKSFFKFLEEIRLLDESLIIIYGDHGPSLPPKWVKYSGNSLYDEHLNVPLIIKQSNWMDNKVNLNYYDYYTSQIKIFETLVKSLNENQPNYLNITPQNKKKFKNYSISEMLHMPKNGHYNFRLVNDKINILAKTKIDWKTKKLKSFLNLNEISGDENRDLCNEYLKQNLEFRHRYENNNFIDKIELE